MSTPDLSKVPSLDLIRVLSDRFEDFCFAAHTPPTPSDPNPQYAELTTWKGTHLTVLGLTLRLARLVNEDLEGRQKGITETTLPPKPRSPKEPHEN